MQRIFVVLGHGCQNHRNENKFSSLFCLFMSSQEMSHLKPSQGALWLSTEAPLNKSPFSEKALT